MEEPVSPIDDMLLDEHSLMTDVSLLESPVRNDKKNLKSQPNLNFSNESGRSRKRSSSQDAIKYPYIDNTAIPRKTIVKSTSRNFESRKLDSSPYMQPLTTTKPLQRPPSSRSIEENPRVKRETLIKNPPKGDKTAIPTRVLPEISPQVITPPNAQNPTGSPSLLSPNISPHEVRDKMDKFIIEHRKYIRNFSDMYKKVDESYLGYGCISTIDSFPVVAKRYKDGIR
eukprot:NODE_338_length_9271_cov_0.444178.p5 type:complete len:227 gc:universal NODE_338_length_9271_cov_0.444178:6721-7401(+)